MNKTELIHQVYDRLNKKVPMKDLDNILDAILDVMADGLQRGEEVQLSEFGTFSIAKKTIQPAIKVVKKK
jgi:nucleoid DNA-binding protein